MPLISFVCLHDIKTTFEQFFLLVQCFSSHQKKQNNMKTFVILGGGIAGVSCAQELVKLFQESCRIILISATETLMEVL